MTVESRSDNGGGGGAPRKGTRNGPSLTSAALAVLRAFGVGAAGAGVTPHERIRVLMKRGAEAGVFDEAERQMVRRVFRLAEQKADSLMTPMKEVVWLDLTDPAELMQGKIRDSPHSRFPVCEGSIDAILGVVDVKDLLIQGFTGRPFSLKGLLTLPLFIYEGTTGLKVLEMFKQSGTHIAVVLDEYGSVLGLLTLNDIFQAIVGDMPTEDEPAAVKIERRPDGSWMLDGMLPLDEFAEAVGLPAPPAGDYRTLAGFVVASLGRIPNIAEQFDWGGFRFEVASMDGHRVDRVVVTPL